MRADDAGSKLSIHCWPQLPPLPQRGQPVVIRVATAPDRREAREELRRALRAVLAAWSGVSGEELPIRETPRGPVWKGFLCGMALDISLAYGWREGLIGLIRGGRIGVDLMRVEAFADAEEVARHYFDPAIAAGLKLAENPAEAFAAAWTQREACLKCFKQGLNEWRAEDEEMETHCIFRNLRVSKQSIAAVAFA